MMPFDLKHCLRTIFKPTHASKGVALLVVAAALAVAGGAAVFTLRSVETGRELFQLRSAYSEFGKIRDALLVSAYQNAEIQLPCPSDPDGTSGSGFGSESNRTGGLCDISRGVVPWLDIGLSEQDVINSRGDYITYIIDNTATNLCDFTRAQQGSLDDLNTGTANDALFTLVDHGENGSGAVIGVGAYNAAPTTTEEQANCPVGSSTSGCTVSNTGQFRSGPASDDSGDFFDDVAFLVEPSTDSFVSDNCIDLNEDGDVSDGGGAGEGGNTAKGGNIGFGDRQLGQLYSRTGNDTSVEFTQQPNINDNFTRSDTNEQLDGLRFVNNGSVDTRSCAWTELSFPIQSGIGENGDYTIRMFLQFGAEVDSGNTRGDGAVIAMLAGNLHDPSSASDPSSTTYTIDSTKCGGPGGEFLGFETDTALAGSITQLPTDFRLGIEMDTESHDGVANNEDDPTNNHVAIVGTTVDHQSLDIASQVTTNTVRAARCDAAATGDGTPRTDNIPVGGSITGSLNDANTTNLHGCYVNDGTTAGWLEQNDDDDADFHTMRIEIVNTDEVNGDNSATRICDVDSNEILVRYWIWPTDSNFGLNCPNTSLCSDLTEDYLQLQTNAGITGSSQDSPTGAQCIPWSTAESLVQMGLVSGADAGANNTEDQFTVRTFTVAFDRDFSNDPTEATGDAETFEINAARLVMHLVTEGFRDAKDTTTEYFPVGLSLIEDIEDDDQAEISSRLGRLVIRMENSGDVTNILNNSSGTYGISGSGGELEDFSTDESIGVDGVDNAEGDEEEMIGNYYDSASDTGSFLPFNLREAVEVRMPNNSYRKVTVNLGSHELTTNGDQEEAIVDLYLNDTFVERHRVLGCSGTNNNAIHKTFSIQAQSPINRIRVTPNPVGDVASSADGSAFSLRGVKFCGTGSSCGLLSHNECYEHINVSDAFPASGIGVGTGNAMDGFGTMTYTIEMARLLARDQFEADSADPESDIISTDSILEAHEPLAQDIQITRDGDDYAWAHIRNRRSNSSDDTHLDILPGNTGERVRYELNTGTARNDGFTVDSGSGDATRLDGGNGTADETLSFRFPADWAQVAFSVGRFGTSGGSGETLNLTAYRDGSQVGTTTVRAGEETTGTCSNTNNHTAYVVWDVFDIHAGRFDRIDITATETPVGNETDVVINAIRACDDQTEAVCELINEEYDNTLYPLSTLGESPECNFRIYTP